MSDDIRPLELRITKIIGEEDRLNRNRKLALKTNDDKRNAEKRKETADLALLETEKNKQVRANSANESAFRTLQEKEGNELVNLSRDIQSAYIKETDHRKATQSSLQQQVTALEEKLRGIEAGRK